jgi:hypothetical protein
MEVCKLDNYQSETVSSLLSNYNKKIKIYILKLKRCHIPCTECWQLNYLLAGWLAGRPGRPGWMAWLAWLAGWLALPGGAGLAWRGWPGLAGWLASLAGWPRCLAWLAGLAGWPG